jgi:hypothetical protein
MNRACSMHEKSEKNDSLGKFEGKRPQEIPRRTWAYNIKMHLKE